MYSIDKFPQFRNIFIFDLQIKSKESLISKLEQDIRLLRKSHDDQLEQQTQMNTNDCDLLRTEIRTLKRVCEERENDVSKITIHLFNFD